jgi:hypothetical protein
VGRPFGAARLWCPRSSRPGCVHYERVAPSHKAAVAVTQMPADAVHTVSEQNGEPMTGREENDDLYTVAAIGLVAMCLVTFDHEALGHGGVCLALGGHIRELTSSIFRCDLRSMWIAPAGPFGNSAGGTASLLLLRLAPRRLKGARLFLILVTSFSFFWEAGYLINAMRVRDGDLYFAGQDFLGEPSLWWRIAGSVAGLCLYVFTARWASRALSDLWPNAGLARRVARTAWVAASLGSALAALAYSGEGWADLSGAVLEIGAGSFPLLFIPRQASALAGTPNPALIERSGATIVLSLAVYAIFTATMGRGLHF